MADSVSQTIPGKAPADQRPDFKRPEYKAGEWARALSRAFMAGTRGVRSLGETALPRWPAERPAFYKLRSTIAQVTRYYARTVEATVGMIAGTPPTLSDTVDPVIEQDWEDIDGRGTHGEVFARQLTEELLVGGFVGILVDAPPVPDGVRLTLASEQALGLRPYWVLVTADQILSWVVEAPQWPELIQAYAAGTLTADQVKALAKQAIVRQVVIHEPTDVAAGTFGMRTADRYRVLQLTAAGVTFAVWEHREAEGASGEHFALISTGAMRGAKNAPLTAIPLAIGYPGRPSAPFVSEPKLLAIAELNLDHYVLTADRRYLMRLTHAPTLFLAGVGVDRDDDGNERPLEVGPNSVVRATDAQAKMSWVAADPNALAESRQERDEIVRQIAALGLSFLAKDRRTSTETAKGRSLDMAAENQSHASVARGLQDLLEQAFTFHAAYRGVQPPEIEMHTAYASPDVDPQLAALVWQAVLKGVLEVSDWVAYLRTGKLPDSASMAMTSSALLAAAEADAAAAAEQAAQTGNAGQLAADGADSVPTAAAA
ncbi:MAG: DUF4055 domain-containing protein [Gemmatimonadaceae bacterium]|nr:DUF4055 domain-containing protein [Gemmatimonadaceae bacterium]